jgi:hypothetical protein
MADVRASRLARRVPQLATNPAHRSRSGMTPTALARSRVVVRGLYDAGGVTELHAEIGVCDTCQRMAAHDLLAEFVQRAVRLSVEKAIIKPGWSRNHVPDWQREYVEALLAAWLARRETFYVITES